MLTEKGLSVKKCKSNCSCKYYSFEMLKTKQPFGVYLIDKVLKRRKKNGVKEALVQWVGYDDPTWILESDIEE